MADVTSTPTPEETPSLGLARRLLGVVFSPGEAYAAVAARPRALGAILVTVLIMVVANGIFLSTEVGKNASLEQQ